MKTDPVIRLVVLDIDGVVSQGEAQPLDLGLLALLAERVDLVYSTACLNVLPRGIDKGKGLEFLSRTTQIPFETILAVGDSDVDLPFLRLAAVSAAPRNANHGVRHWVDTVSPHADAQGVRYILGHFGLRP